MAQQPGYRTIVTGAAQNGAAGTVTLPAATAVNDLLVISAQTEWGPASLPKTAPTGNISGWTVRVTGYDNATDGLHHVVATARATAAGASVITFPNGNQADAVWAITVINGATVDPTTPVTVSAATATGAASQTHTAPAITPPTNNSLLLWLFATPIAPSTGATYSTTTSKLVERISRTYITGAIYGVYTTSTAQRAALSVSASGATAAKWSGVSVVVNGAPDAPTAAKIATLTDRFDTEVNTTRWPTRNFVTYDAGRAAALIPAAYVGGAPQYAAMRSAEIYTMSGGSTFNFRVRFMPEGNANAQAWVKQPDAQGVGRVGFEYVASANRLDCIGQGASYATLGTTTSLTYDENLHRYLMVELTSANVLTWYTSADATNWTVRRSLAASSVPSWLTTRTDLSLSFEGFGNASGVSSSFIVDDVNLPAPAEPTWSPAMTGGAVTWAADMTQADCVAADYIDDRWQRQTATGAMGVVDDVLVPWPIPCLPAPFGRPGRAMRVRLPDAHRRYECVPDVPHWLDGDATFVGFSLYIEADTDTIAGAGNYYQTVWQLRPTDSSGSPTVALEVIEGELQLTGGYGRPNPAGGAAFGAEQQYRVTLLSPVPKGQWLDVVLFIGMWSSLNSGRVDVWVNGTQVLTNYKPKPGTNFGTQGGEAYPKNGIYHDGGNRGATVWFADHRHGTSYNVVNPNRAIAAYADYVPVAE